MENKTIDHLNTKAWYRFLKVLYLLLFLAILIITNILILENGMARLDRSKTLIYCKAGDKRILTAEKSNIYFSDNDFRDGFDYKKYFEGYNESNIRDIYRSCYDVLPLDDIYVIQRHYEITGTKAEPKKYDKEYLDEQIKKMTTGYKTNGEKAGYLDYSVKLFDVSPVYSSNESISQLIVANLIIIFCFEFFRRIFYYVVLGKIRPKK